MRVRSWRRASTPAVLVLVSALTPLGAPAWDNIVAHELLADQAIERLSTSGGPELYLEQELDLENGLNQKLALQLGFESLQADPSVEQDLAPNGAEGGGSRLRESLNLGEAIPEEAAEDIVLGLHERCPRPLGFEACFEELRERGDAVRKLLRAGTFAEDNPNPRAQHHFHDPERAHPPPAGSHGLDNSEAFLRGLEVQLAGTRARAGGRSPGRARAPGARA